MTQLAPQLQSAKSSLERIFSVLDELDEEDANALELTAGLTGQVSFEQVEFGYSEDKPLIRNFNLDVKPGEMVAIVGPTGQVRQPLSTCSCVSMMSHQVLSR